ncbi:FtsB family cell division protein [Anaerosphaera multitolerans]|uniref:Cell division protein FtsL n=1 Tax=Anaerosphaera multitolerans TaxID=2487351 RepID=A0A437S723_9FIRM|nr:septum formation initiator family protein [Anaerosphaera multitolerans]RVU54781.1 cell division protein FtsL [Anaerosphaera multitolerans]
MYLNKKQASSVKVQKKKKKAYKNSKKNLYITLLIVMIILFGVTFTYAQLANLDKQIIAQQKEIEDLEKTKSSLVGEIKGIKSSSQIQEEAMYKLGMVFPKEEQIVYVDISKDEEQKDVNNNVFLSPIISVLKSFTKD